MASRQVRQPIVPDQLLCALVRVSLESLELAHVVLADAIVDLALLELDLVVLHLLESVCAHSEAEAVDIAIVELVAPTIHQLPPEICVVLLANLLLADAHVDLLLGEGTVIML